MDQTDKKNLRSALLEKRLKLAPEKARDLSLIVQKHVLESRFWPTSGRVGLYWSVKNEVLTNTLFQQAIESGLHVFFPRVAGGIWYYEVNGPEDLTRGSWGVMEPVEHCEPLPDDERLSLIIVPGLVFSEMGYRVGYGRGLYDKFLSVAPVDKTVGIAYDFQMIKSFPTDDWDVPLDAVITERATYLPKDKVV